MPTRRRRHVLVAIAVSATTLVAGRPRPGHRRGGGSRRAAAEGRHHGAVRHLQRLVEPRRAGELVAGPVHPRRPAGRRGGGDRPARAPGRAAGQRVRLRARPRGGRPVPHQLPRGVPARRAADRLPVRVRRAVEHRRAVGPRPRTTTARSAGATTRSGSACSRASTGWRCSRSTRSPPTGSAPSSTSAGRTCPAPCCRTTRPPRRPQDWYSAEELEDVRLSSKSHWDVPVRVGANHRGRAVARCTSSSRTRRRPPSTAPEDRNGTRNHDEIRFWADYVSGGRDARYVYDDAGRRGGLARGASFVVAGDQNSDPVDGDSVPGAIQQLLDHPRVTDPRPASRGAEEASALQGGANLAHEGNPRYDTADFADTAARQPAGRLRPAVRRPGGAWTRACSGRCRPTRCRASPAPSRSRPRTTARCGSTCGSGAADGADR